MCEEPLRHRSPPPKQGLELPARKLRKDCIMKWHTHHHNYYVSLTEISSTVWFMWSAKIPKSPERVLYFDVTDSRAHDIIFSTFCITMEPNHLPIGLCPKLVALWSDCIRGFTCKPPAQSVFRYDWTSHISSRTDLIKLWLNYENISPAMCIWRRDNRKKQREIERENYIQ